jgi:hypothetical protein
MANFLNGKGGMLTKGALAAGAAAVIDGVTEYSQAPLFNDESNIFPGRSNVEVILYGLGIFGTVTSLFAMLSKQRLFGNVGSDLLAPSIGAVAGTYVYENIIAPAVIRK